MLHYANYNQAPPPCDNLSAVPDNIIMVQENRILYELDSNKCRKIEKLIQQLLPRLSNKIEKIIWYTLSQVFCPTLGNEWKENIGNINDMHIT